LAIPYPQQALFDISWRCVSAIPYPQQALFDNCFSAQAPLEGHAVQLLQRFGTFPTLKRKMLRFITPSLMAEDQTLDMVVHAKELAKVFQKFDYHRVGHLEEEDLLKGLQESGCAFSLGPPSLLLRQYTVGPAHAVPPRAAPWAPRGCHEVQRAPAKRLLNALTRCGSEQVQGVCGRDPTNDGGV
jgi:hypothetical protein